MRSTETGKRIFLLCLILAAPTTLWPQESYDRSTVLIEDLIGSLADEDGEDRDYNTLFGDLLGYLDHPLALNEAGYGELEGLQVLTHYQITNLLEYIGTNGPVLSLSELALVDGFTPELVSMIAPLVRLEPPVPDRRAMQGRQGSGITRQQLLLRTKGVFQQRQGYAPASDSLLAASPNARYTGSPVKLYTRYTLSSGRNFTAGFTAEKDAGEEFFNGSNRQGFDYYSAHIQFDNLWKLKRLVVGDYQVGMGQGLVMWSGFSFGKSPEVLNIRKKSQDIRKYSSTDENRFLRGIGGTVQFGATELTAFISRKKIDANATLRDSATGRLLEFSSFQSSGLHAVPGEIEDERSLPETVGGGHLSRRIANGRVGLSFIAYRFGGERIPPSGITASPFTGSQGFNAGMDYQFAWKKVVAFGEAGMNDGQSLALLNGITVALTPEFSLSLMHRYFQKDYSALYGNAFSESSGNSNEHALYVGAVLDPFPNWTFSGSVDSYSFPWLTAYLPVLTGSGYDLLLQAEFRNANDLSFYVRYKRESGPAQTRLELPGIDDVVRESIDRLRLNLSYPAGDHVEFHDRLEFSKYGKEAENQSGALIYHDILYRPASGRLSLTFRYCMFNTGGYASRIYAYEHDVLYALSLPSLYDRGTRTYLNARCAVSDRLDLWMKVADTWYPGKQSIGSGLYEITGRHRTDFSVQLRLRL